MPLFNSIVFPSLITSLGWGISPICHKINIKLVKNDYILIFLIHLLFISLITLGFIIYNYRKLLDLKNNTDINKILLLGIIGSFSTAVLGYYFYFKALSSSNSTILVILITYIVPLVIVAVLSKVLLQERINSGMIFGLFLSILGIIVFTYFNTQETKN